MKKKLITAILALIVAIPTTTIIANGAESTKKDEVEEALNKKAMKLARNEAKQLKKEGYKPIPGALPLEKQLDEVYRMREQRNDDGQKKYFFGTSESVGQTFDAAAQQATLVARERIAEEIQTEVTTIVEMTLANEQISATEAASISKSISQSQSFISNTLAGTITVLQAYKQLPNGNVQVTVTIAYPRANAMKVANAALRKNLEGDVDNLMNKINIQ